MEHNHYLPNKMGQLTRDVNTEMLKTKPVMQDQIAFMNWAEIFQFIFNFQRASSTAADHNASGY